MDTGRLPFARDEFDTPVPAQSSSHASRQAAERLKAKGQQGEKARRLLKALLETDLIDSEIERATGLPRQSICSLRRSAVKRGLVTAVGERMGPYGTEQTVWRVTGQGREAIAMTDEHPMSGACHRCVHRQDIPGSAHSSCHHPALADLHAQPSMQFARLAGRRGGDGMIASVQIAAAHLARRLNVTGHERGINGRWFIWPVNFDPTWLESCDGFTAKDVELAERLATYGGVSD